MLGSVGKKCNVNLPKYIEIFAVATTAFSTFCAVTKSGREMRSSNSLLPKRSYLLQNCHLSKVQFEVFNEFFMLEMVRSLPFV